MAKIYIKTLGCEKNTVDSEYAAGLLLKKGHKIVNDPNKADFLLVNTCSFINDAKKQSIEEILFLASIKANKTLIVTGCLGQRYAKELKKELPEVDYFLGVNDYSKLPDIISGKCNENVNVSLPPLTFEEFRERDIHTNKYSRSIKIAEGCSNICSYCAIPKIRGKYRSRKASAIIKEAKKLAEEGCKELVIIAQDVTNYGKDLGEKDGLSKLLRKLCKIDGIKWIRLMYCYENEITDELINTIRDEEKIVKYIDIPIQHCSDKILKAMNRKSTKKSIFMTIQKLRYSIPGIVIRTTLITGFPGESKKEFDEMYTFVHDMRFDRLGVFAYSKEEGTKAALMKGQVRSDIKQKRLDMLMELQRSISLENNKAYIGKTIDVIVEEKDQDGTYTGRASFDAEGIDNGVIFISKKKLRIGQFVKVLVLDAFDYDLLGEVVG